jgi:hypothetical protein
MINLKGYRRKWQSWHLLLTEKNHKNLGKGSFMAGICTRNVPDKFCHSFGVSHTNKILIFSAVPSSESVSY